MSEQWTEETRKRLEELLGYDHDTMSSWSVRDLQDLVKAALIDRARVNGRVLEVLKEIRDELDNRSDAEYVDGVPRGNWAMSLLEPVDEAIALAERI